MSPGKVPKDNSDDVKLSKPRDDSKEQQLKSSKPKNEDKVEDLSNDEPRDKDFLILLANIQDEDYETVSEALETLFTLLQGDEEPKTLNVTGYGTFHAKTIVDTMTKWLDREPIQVWGTGCLGYLSSSSVAGRCAVWQAGAFQAVVTAMKAHEESLTMQSNGCGVVVNLLGPKPTNALKTTTRQFVDEWNGLQVIREAMFLFPDAAQLQLMGCAIFWRLSNEQDLYFHAAMIHKGVVAAVAFALELHLEDTKIQQLSKAFMQNIFSDRGALGDPSGQQVLLFSA